MSSEGNLPEPIPLLRLMHKGEPSNMAFRTMEEIEKVRGNVPEVPHRHTYFTVVWIRSGNGFHTLDFNRFPLAPESVCVIAPGQVHNFELEGPQGFVWMFTPEFLIRHNLHQIMHDGIIAPFACDVNEPKEVPQKLRADLEYIFHQAEKELNTTGKAMKQEALAAYLHLFLVFYRRLLPDSEAAQKSTASLSLSKKFKALVENQFSNNHVVTDYAQQLQVTTMHLNDSVKNETGQTPKQVIASRILLEAKRLAVHSQLSTKEVAYSLGFEDPLHFGKFFKTKAGTSFLEFRQKLLEGVLD
jgi:AraC family transcriptional regulator, transcriptional activator of pobA